MRIFLDTSGLIALSDRKDRNHETARAYLEDNVHKGARFVLGRNVLVEYIDGVLHNILNSKLLVIEPVSKVDWDLAVKYFRKYDDQRIDITDCLSFALMERLGLDTAMTFDSDFRTHGFKVVI